MCISCFYFYHNRKICAKKDLAGICLKLFFLCTVNEDFGNFIAGVLGVVFAHIFDEPGFFAAELGDRADEVRGVLLKEHERKPEFFKIFGVFNLVSARISLRQGNEQGRFLEKRDFVDGI